MAIGKPNKTLDLHLGQVIIDMCPCGKKTKPETTPTCLVWIAGKVQALARMCVECTKAGKTLDDYPDFRRTAR